MAQPSSSSAPIASSSNAPQPQQQTRSQNKRRSGFPGLKRRSARWGKLAPMLSLPSELHLMIFEHLDSMDLIRLERTPVVRNMVVGNDRAYRAQATMSGLPEFQSKDWPLRKWFHLIFEKECMMCEKKSGGKVRDADYALRVRLCGPCKAQNLASESTIREEITKLGYDKDALDYLSRCVLNVDVENVAFKYRRYLANRGDKHVYFKPSAIRFARIFSQLDNSGAPDADDDSSADEPEPRRNNNDDDDSDNDSSDDDDSGSSDSSVTRRATAAGAMALDDSSDSDSSADEVPLQPPQTAARANTDAAATSNAVAANKSPPKKRKKLLGDRARFVREQEALRAAIKADCAALASWQPSQVSQRVQAEEIRAQRRTTMRERLLAEGFPEADVTSGLQHPSVRRIVDQPYQCTEHVYRANVDALRAAIESARFERTVLRTLPTSQTFLRLTISFARDLALAPHGISNLRKAHRMRFRDLFEEMVTSNEANWYWNTNTATTAWEAQRIAAIRGAYETLKCKFTSAGAAKILGREVLSRIAPFLPPGEVVLDDPEPTTTQANANASASSSASPAVPQASTPEPQLPVLQSESATPREQRFASTGSAASPAAAAAPPSTGVSGNNIIDNININTDDDGDGESPAYVPPALASGHDSGDDDSSDDEAGRGGGGGSPAPQGANASADSSDDE